MNVTRVVAAARKVVERHRGPGDLSSLLDTIDDLAAALEAQDGAGSDEIADTLDPQLAAVAKGAP